ncbi:hypothetical protein CCR80_11005 [Rhodothalassium salexigens]|uniref:dienelactone hydrolase family protein n=1 Tax=Rhodothalassium salexigens TaxID=1086 RepID=UPI001911FA98|nr:dienelactone hydrolase family protein [Rhodothalassium salexigens]MBK5921557.1 hypothetical protein [Rhodothalassium salexigens]
MTCRSFTAAGLRRLALAGAALAAGWAPMAWAQQDVPPPPSADDSQSAYRTITIPGGNDGLDITADLYEPETRSFTVMVLFHQARSSRGEYRTIAPRLADKGYTALAVDLRAGERYANVDNQTARRAQAAGLDTGYRDAIPDMLAALRYADTELRGARVVAWGSSYSASLSLYLASRHRDLIDGVVAFSPGDYFRGKIDLVAAARYIDQPVFLTGMQSESRTWKPIYDALPDEMSRRGLHPDGRGAHGAVALIPRKSPNHKEYWLVLESFLTENF